MAEIMGALCVPHTPVFPMLAEKQGPDGEINRYFARAKAELERMRPDVIVMFDTDHLNTFFFDHLPVFAIGVDATFQGPCDEVPNVPPRSIPSQPELAGFLRERLIRTGFDVSLVQQFEVDHSIGVPLYFLTPQFDIPVIPFFINGHVPPLPSARRCYELGEAVRTAVRDWPKNLRVLIVGTGSFSLEVAGPRIAPNSSFGVPDPDWCLHVQARMEAGEADRLIEEATEERMLAAGNVGGELLNVVAMLGTVGGRKAKWMQDQVANGHAFGAWEGDRT